MKPLIAIVLALLAGCAKSGPWPLMHDYERIESAPRDGTIVQICLLAYGYEGWCNLFFWGADVSGSSAGWVSVDEASKGLMDERQNMADGTRSGDLLQWRRLSENEVYTHVADHERAERLLKNQLTRITN
jgi:hypothetical protein